MSNVTEPKGYDDMVRLEFKIQAMGQIFLTQDEWEAYASGAQLAGDRVADLLDAARYELLQDGSVELVLEKAVLVEADGYLGTDIATLVKY